MIIYNIYKDEDEMWHSWSLTADSFVVAVLAVDNAVTSPRSRNTITFRTIELLTDASCNKTVRQTVDETYKNAVAPTLRLK